ncbi:hypothetical protein NL676_021691 [Syzygium grande]|nr:hypothetical protein NL676_021691 [Syzygium grande]
MEWASFSAVSARMPPPPPPPSSSVFVSSKSLSLLLPHKSFPFPSRPARPFSSSPLRMSSSLPNPVPKTSVAAAAITVPPSFPKAFASRRAPYEPRKGSDVLVEALERQGVTKVFAYPGGASMEIHGPSPAGRRREHPPRPSGRHFTAAEGYAAPPGLPICIATSGPNATNLIIGLADAMLDKDPHCRHHRQVPRRMIGTGAFQEIPIVEVTRSITKDNYLVLDVKDIPRVVREAFYLATSGRPGPVHIDIPKDIQQQLVVPNWDKPVRLSGYTSRLPKPPQEAQLE